MISQNLSPFMMNTDIRDLILKCHIFSRVGGYVIDKTLGDLTKITEELSDFSKSFRGHQFVSVPQYDDDQMVPNESHYNVTKIQLERGGRTVLGFRILQTESELLVSHHSVWQIPTGSLVDVTLDEPMIFLPVNYYDANKEWYFTRTSFRFPSSTKRTRILQSLDGQKWVEKPRRWLRDEKIGCEIIHHRKYPRYEDEGYQEYLENHYKSIKEIRKSIFSSYS